MLAPTQPHRGAIDRQIDIADHRAFLDTRRTTTARTTRVGHDLFNDQLDVATTTGIVQDPDVLQPNQRPQDLARLGHDEGTSNLLAHTSSLKRLRPISPDPHPAEIRRAT